ncbi:aldose 1-epimerase [Aureobasidium subglaciale]|nr:aldose 1-epimerase [Aureobasidium subglaciale]
MSTEDAFAFLAQGAIIQELRIAGHNIVQGFPTAEPYKTKNSAYFGETIGRVANRIKNAEIQNLNGRSYKLTANNGPNALHGGPAGWGKRTFDGPIPVNRNGTEAVQFKYLSKDGEEGYPGTVELRVWYAASKKNDEGVEKTQLEIEYEVELVGDEVEETVVSVTNHSYFNISGGETIEGTEATLMTDQHMVVDDTDIPTGQIKSFPGVEAEKAFTLGAVDPDIDHCFVINTDPSSVPLDTRPETPRKLCSFFHPTTKLHFEVLSTEPAFQFYTGKYIDIPAVEGAPARGARAGFCVEPSRYIDAANNNDWKKMVLLKKGQTYGSKIIYRGWKE